MMWSQCYGALCSLLQSVPLPQTKAINRMKLAEQCWVPVKYRSNCVDVAKNTNTSIAAHLLIMLILFLLYWAHSTWHRVTRKIEEGGGEGGTRV